jgi:hypothetical protein
MIPYVGYPNPNHTRPIQWEGNNNVQFNYSYSYYDSYTYYCSHYCCYSSSSSSSSSYDNEDDDDSYISSSSIIETFLFKTLTRMING